MYILYIVEDEHKIGMQLIKCIVLQRRAYNINLSNHRQTEKWKSHTHTHTHTHTRHP